MGKWIFSYGKWEIFKYICEIEMDKIEFGDIEEIDIKVKTALIEAANQSISKSKGRMNRKAVPWWTEECSKVVRERNIALGKLRRTHNFLNLIKYKEAQAKVRKVIRKAKRQSWQTFCNKIGRSTPVGDVWNMIRGMRGIRREWQYPALKMGEEAAGSDEEKAEMIVNALTQIHSSDNLTEEGKRGREGTRSAYLEFLKEGKKIIVQWMLHLQWRK